MRALIVDGGSFGGAPAAARALHGAGWRVGIGSPSSRDPAAASRAVRSWHPVPSPDADLDAFAAAVEAAARDGGYDVVLPTGDTHMLALALVRDRIGALVPYPETEIVRASIDKLELARRASSLEIPAPRTVPADGALASMGKSEVVVVKSRLHSFPGAGSTPRFRAAAVCRGPAEAAARAAAIRGEGGEPLIQEPVDGRLLSVAVVRDGGGRRIGLAGQLAERTWPEPVGGTARGRTVEVRPDVLGHIDRLLDDLRWTGLAQVQFMLGRDGTARLIDVNGRIYGSIALAIRAGVNLVDLWARSALGLDVAAASARTGVRYQSFEGDLKRALLSGAAKMPRELFGAVAYSFGSCHAIWSPRDPAPALRYTALLARRALSKVTRGRRGA